MEKMTIGWIQYSSLQHKENSEQILLEDCEKAVHKGAKLIVLPELCLLDYFPQEENPENFELAISIQSSCIQKFQTFCKAKSVAIIFPFFEKKGRGIFYNTSLLIDSKGQIKNEYQKTHIPDDPGFFEKYYFTPGDQIFVSEFESVKLGMQICWDQWFPESARLLALQGAEILIYPTAIAWDLREDSSLYKTQLESWLTLLKSHAIANGVWVLAVNRIGTEKNLKFWGHSVLIAPDGSVQNTPSEQKEIVVQTIEFNQIDEARKSWPFFRDRRVDLYSPLQNHWNSKS